MGELAERAQKRTEERAVHTTRAHAKLGPSAAHRWMNCPGSIKASEGIDPLTSKYAAEGTAAHELATQVLNFGWESAHSFVGQNVHIHAKEPETVVTPYGEPNQRDVWEVTEEMADSVDEYVGFVRELIEQVNDGIAITDVEQRLDMSHIHKDIFGTGDAVVYNPVEQHLHVCDFKYGKGVVVSVEENPQLFLYAAGAVRRYHNQPVRKVSMHIVQPRAEGKTIKSWETDLLDLMDFEGEVAIAAKRTEDPDAPRAAGDWCRFCPAAPICPVRRELAYEDAKAEFDDGAEEVTLTPVDALSDEEAARILRNADRIGNYVTAVQEYMHARAVNGQMPSGYKLVAKRAIRKWRDEGRAIEILVPAAHANGRDKADLYTEPKFKSPAQIEKTLGKKVFEKLEAQLAAEDEPALTVKQSSGLNLVPSDDPRPAVSVDATAEFSAVDSVEN